MTISIEQKGRLNRHRVVYKGHRIAEARKTESGLWTITPSRRYYQGGESLTKLMNESQIADFAKKATLRGEPL